METARVLWLLIPAMTYLVIVVLLFLFSCVYEFTGRRRWMNKVLCGITCVMALSSLLMLLEAGKRYDDVLMGGQEIVEQRKAERTGEPVCAICDMIDWTEWSEINFCGICGRYITHAERFPYNRVSEE